MSFHNQVEQVSREITWLAIKTFQRSSQLESIGFNIKKQLQILTIFLAIDCNWRHFL